MRAGLSSGLGSGVQLWAPRIQGAGAGAFTLTLSGSGTGTSVAPWKMANCVLGARADQGVTIATGVSQWNDLSGNGNHLLQATGTNQPVFTASNAVFNGKPTIDGDGVNDLLRATFTLPTPVEIFLVGKWNNIGGSTGTIVDGTLATAPARFCRVTNSTSIRLLSNNNGSSLVASGQTPEAAHCYHILVVNNAMQIFVDGVSVAGPSVQAVSPALSGITVFSYGGTFDWAQASVAEIAVFSAAQSSGDRALQHAYSQFEYGTP